MEATTYRNAENTTLQIIADQPGFVQDAELQQMSDEINEMIDNLWMLIVVVHVLMMQLGFVMLEVGTIRPKNGRNIIYKNLVDIFVCALTFYFVGYGHANNNDGGLWGSGGFFD